LSSPRPDQREEEPSKVINDEKLENVNKKLTLVKKPKNT
jgi:hypothetical protein